MSNQCLRRPSCELFLMSGSRNTAMSKTTQQIGRETVSNDPMCNKSRVEVGNLSDFCVRKLIASTFVYIAP